METLAEDIVNDWLPVIAVGLSPILLAIVNRLLDWFFPKDHHSPRVRGIEHSTKEEDNVE